MTSRQWLLITLVVVLNIIIFGALIGPPPEVERANTPTPTWSPYPTFTPPPRPTSTAILMPTLEATALPLE